MHVGRSAAIAALALSIALGIAGQLLMKWVALRTVDMTITWSLLGSLAMALAVYSAGIVNWMLALRRLPLSVAYQVTSINYIGILAGAHYWFGERVSAARVVGVTLIFLGVLLVVLGAGRGPRSKQVVSRRLHWSRWKP
jgi:multidrug transporter EmrE-like cation transporter